MTVHLAARLWIASRQLVSYVVHISCTQALTLSFCTKWPFAPVDVKVAASPQKKKLLTRNVFYLFKKTLFLAINRISSRRLRVWPLFILLLVIYFHAFSNYPDCRQCCCRSRLRIINALCRRRRRSMSRFETTGDAAASYS